MKHFLVSVFLLFQFSVVSKAQWVTIPDPNFVVFLQMNYPTCMNGNQMDTTCSQIVNETTLDLSSVGITNFYGLGYFNALNFLDCSDNQLTNLPDLPAGLTVLYCHFNLLTSLPPLPIGLTHFGCVENMLSTLPILPNGLVELDCSNNHLTNLPLLPNTLLSLGCVGNMLTSLPSLPNGLTILDCSGNALFALPSLPIGLLNFGCSFNQLTTLPALPPGLINFSCAFNQLTSLPSLPDSMNQFYINDNNIVCLANLPSNIANGNISNNPLTCIPNQTNYNFGLPLCIDNDPINNPNNCISMTNLTGLVYSDTDSNCTYSAVDTKPDNLPVKLYDTQNNLLSICYITNGIYGFSFLQPDTFLIKIEDNFLPIAMDCSQPNTQIAILDSSTQTLSSINFPVVCDTAYDINIQSVYRQGWVFPGQQHTLNTTVTNNETWYNIDCGSNNNSGPAIITITGPVSFASALPGALVPTVNGNVFTYNVTDFNTLNSNSFGLQFQTDTSAQTGDQICVHVEIYPSPLDADTVNNVYDFCYNVVNSYDPNMKEVYPKDVLPGYNDWFTYTIHFQNTGTAPAFNIRLRDTLDANLDINTFEFLGASHQAYTSVNGHNLIVRFNNIMLPDSTTDYEGSMGYYQYRIKPLSGLPVGTDIENTAYIYFDYNPAIVTNTTHNIFDMATADKTLENRSTYTVYPNPSSGVFNLKENKNIRNVDVYNLFGEKLLPLNNTKQIDLSAYPKGIYIAKINGQYVSKLVKE